MDSAKISECPERERYVTIIMDEMKIRKNLVYNKHTGKQAIVMYTKCILISFAKIRRDYWIH